MRSGAMDYTIVVVRNRHPSWRRCSTLRRIPAAAIGEYFMDKGKDVLVIYDDLSQARGGLPCTFPAASTVRQDVRLIRVTYSICTPVCWSVQRTSRMNWAAVL